MKFGLFMKADIISRAGYISFREIRTMVIFSSG